MHTHCKELKQFGNIKRKKETVPSLLLSLACLRGKPLLTVQFLSSQTFLYIHAKQLFKNVPTTGFFMSSRHFLIRTQANPLHFKKAATWFIYKCGKIYFATSLLMDIDNVSNHFMQFLLDGSNCVTNCLCSLTFGQMPQNRLLFRSF